MQERVCNICGTTLQSADPAVVGFVPGRVLLGTSQSVCQRCHRTRMAPVLAGRNQEDGSGGVRRVLEKADLSLLVIDITDFEGTFSKRLMRNCGRKLMLVANKIDLLPGRTPRGEVLTWVNQRLADAHVTPQGVFLISISKGIGTTALWDAVKKELNGRGTVTVVGVEGVGKTALVNNWIEYNKTQDTKKKRVRRKSKNNAAGDPPDTTNTAGSEDEKVKAEPVQQPAAERNAQKRGAADAPSDNASNSEIEPLAIFEQPALFDLVPGSKSDTAVTSAVQITATDGEQSDHNQQEDLTAPKATSGQKTTAPLPIEDDGGSSGSDAADASTAHAVSSKPYRRRRSYPARRRPQKPGATANAANTDSPSSGAAQTTKKPAPAETNDTRPKAESGAPAQQQSDTKAEQKSGAKKSRSRRRKPKKPTAAADAKPDTKSDATPGVAKPEKPQGQSQKKLRQAPKAPQVAADKPGNESSDAPKSESGTPKTKSNRRRPRRRRTHEPTPVATPDAAAAQVAKEPEQQPAQQKSTTTAKDTAQSTGVSGAEPATAKGKSQPKGPVTPKQPPAAKPERVEIKVIDTLSVPARGRMRDFLCVECMQTLAIQKPLRSKVLRLKVGQAAVFSGLAAISVQEIVGKEKTAFLLLFLPPSITVQRVSSEALDAFLRKESTPWSMDVCATCTGHLLQGGWEETEMSVDAQHDLALHGMGWISVRKSSVSLRVLVPAGMLASMRPRLVGPKQ